MANKKADGTLDGTYSVATGYANAPTFTAGTASFVKDSDGVYAEVVFVTAYTPDATTSEQNVFYLLDTTPADVYDSATAHHYEYKAIVGGKADVIKVKSTDNTDFATLLTRQGGKGLYVYTETNGYVNVAAGTYDTDHYTAAPAPVSARMAGAKTSAGTINYALGYNKFIFNENTVGTPTNGLVAIGTTEYTYTSSTIVFVIEADGTFKMGNSADIVAGASYNGVYGVSLADSKTATSAQEATLYAMFIQK